MWDGNKALSLLRRSRPRQSVPLRPPIRILFRTRQLTQTPPIVRSPAVQVSPPPLPARGFLNIVRHGAGASAIYVVTYCRLDRVEITPKPVLAEGARTLLDLLERLGVNLELKEVRGALQDIHRLGSANIPDLWLSDEQMAEKGLIED